MYKNNYKKFQQKYKDRHDRDREIHNFKEGDVAWLYLSKISS